MAEFEDKLHAILGDPEAMGQIVSIAKALTGDGTASPGEEEPASPSAASEEPVFEPVEPLSAAPSSSGGTDSAPDWSALLGLLGNLNGGGGESNPLSLLGDLDPALVQKALRLFSEYRSTDDRKVALLNALKPFLKEERLAKLDQAVQIAKLSRLIRVAFLLFQKEGSDNGAL